MNSTRIQIPKLLAVIATYSITAACPSLADTGQVDKDVDARKFKLLFQELAIDPEDLAKDSLNKNLIDSLDRHRPTDITRGTGSLRESDSASDHFSPDLTRNRAGLETGIGGNITTRIDSERDRYSESTPFAPGIEYEDGVFYVKHGARVVAVMVVSRENEGALSDDDANIFYYGDDENPGSFIYESNMDNLSDESAADYLRELAEDRLEEDDDEGEVLGGNDNDDGGGKAGPLNEFRPLSDGSNGTIRFGKADPKGGELKGDAGSSNSAFDTLRFAPGTEEKIKASRTEDYNPGVIAFLNEIMNGGGGFDPSGWDDSDESDGFGEIQGNIGGGSL